MFQWEYMQSVIYVREKTFSMHILHRIQIIHCVYQQKPAGFESECVNCASYITDNDTFGDK